MHGFVRPGEELFDAARGLADAMLVLHQGDAHIAFAILAEAEAGRHGYVGLVDEHLGELDGAEFTEGLRNRRPGEHGGDRRRDRPASPAEAFYHAVAPRLVDLADLLHAVLRAVESRRRGH